MNPAEPPYNTQTTPGTALPRQRLHPAVLAAAASILLLSAVGIATLLYTRSSATTATSLPPSAAQLAPPPAAAAPAVAPAAPPAVAPTVAPTVAPPSPAPAPVRPRVATAVTPIEEVAPAASPAARYPAPPHGGSARPPGYGAPVGPALAEASPPPACASCATVLSLREVKIAGEATGVGAVGGGLAGGVVGNQIGSGNGRTAMTFLGALGGALAGNAIEKNARSRTEYEMRVRYDDGRTRTFISPKPWPYGVGDPVRVINGAVRPRA